MVAAIFLLRPVLAQADEAQVSRTNAAPVVGREELDGRWHTIRRKVSPKLPKITPCDKINPVWWFKNADEPVPPDWFRPGEKRRSFNWFFRNPFHNFTHYVIGIADKPHERSGRYPGKISNPNGGWLFTVVKYKWLRLPFISYRREKFEFYFGWRVLGNFGIKINFNPERTHPLKPAPHAKDAKGAKVDGQALP